MGDGGEGSGDDDGDGHHDHMHETPQHKAATEASPPMQGK